MNLSFYSHIKKNKLHARAVQIYSILISAAHNRQTMTYKMLASQLGYRGAGVLDRQLGLIMHWCADNELPPLTVLVVNSDTGLPGDGLVRIQELHSDREKVFNYPWFTIVAPAISDLTPYGALR